MNRALLITLCFLWADSALQASCHVGSGKQDDPPLAQCLYDQWKKKPTRENLRELLHPLFYDYVSDPDSLPMRSFFEDLRRRNHFLPIVNDFRQDLVRRYTFPGETVQETAAIWAMPPADARALFLLSQIDPRVLSDEISRAMHRAIYDQLREVFFKSSLRRQFGFFEPAEYTRIQEILKRMAWMPDPFLKNLNLFYHAVVLLNLGHQTEGVDLLHMVRSRFEEYLHQAREKLARKRILACMADVDRVLGNTGDAERTYIGILKIDPQDWNALMNLSYVLNEQHKCSEDSVWVEATIRSDQELFDIVVHCGSQELLFPEPEPEGPVMAMRRARPGHTADGDRAASR